MPAQRRQRWGGHARRMDKAIIAEKEMRRAKARGQGKGEVRKNSHSLTAVLVRAFQVRRRHVTAPFRIALQNNSICFNSGNFLGRASPLYRLPSLHYAPRPCFLDLVPRSPHSPNLPRIIRTQHFRAKLIHKLNGPRSLLPCSPPARSSLPVISLTPPQLPGPLLQGSAFFFQTELYLDSSAASFSSPFPALQLVSSTYSINLFVFCQHELGIYSTLY